METFQNRGQRLSIKGKKRRFGNTLTSQPLMAHPENVSPDKCFAWFSFDSQKEKLKRQ